MLVAAIFLLRNRNQSDSGTKPRRETTTTVNRDRGFDRRYGNLEYTRHAKCRMDCRKITASEVQYIMRNGTVNYRKSNVNANPCPVYALEGVTDDNQRVRIVFAQCNEVTKVVTCIDLEKEWQCDCPGDDDKYKNKER